jgi:hypothetical protein
MPNNHFPIATAVTAPGWLPAVRVGGGPLSVRALQAIAQGADAAFDLEVWVTCAENDAATEPVGLVKLAPNFTGAVTTEFDQVASELYLFDAPFVWIRVRVISLEGALDVLGVP